MNQEPRGKSIVVVTGGAGYIGSWVVRRLLEQGCRVRVIDCLLHGGGGLLPLFGHPDLELIRSSILDNGTVDRSLAGASAVLHLAAIVGDGPCSRDAGATLATNVAGTRRILEAAARAGVQRFVLASTCSVYGASGDNGVLTEESPINPVSLYAESKIEAEGIVLNSGHDTLVPTVLRLSTLYGFSPRMRFDLALNFFAGRVAQGAEVVIYGRHHWRPMLHVADCAGAFVRVLSAPADAVRGQVFNVGVDRENYQMGQFLSIVPEVIPGARVVCREATRDPRSYHVGFGKIQRALDYDVAHTVRTGLAEVHRLVREGWLSDPESPQYRN